MISMIHTFLNRYSYLVYLLTLVFWIGFLPLFEITGFITGIEFILVNVIIVSAFYFFKRRDKPIILWLFLTTTLLVNCLNFIYDSNPYFSQMFRLSIMLLFLFITVHFMHIIFKSKIVTIEIIYIAISTYLMAGIVVSILCWFTYNLYPGAYNFQVKTGGPLSEFMYYAFITMTTVGYGDDLPLLPQSKSLSVIIALLGQFYMTLLMAILIGKYLNQQHDKV